MTAADTVCWWTWERLMEQTKPVYQRCGNSYVFWIPTGYVFCLN